MAKEHEEIILTREGIKKLEDELEELKGPRRKELSQRLKLAISYGDLKENSEYHSAKDDQAFMETRVLILEKMLRNAQVVNADNLDLSKVSIGSTILLHDLEFGEDIEYQIVGPAEADVINNKLSYESPLGKALIGQKVGNTITFEAPMGTFKYKLLEIRIV
ncbi:transcription elongation factor GreA [Paenibacillus sp. PsM32]|uniref:Transcription elongation factor GreA n=1 Tax=Paenibacillus kyungheensis TaxID=1452732 RepID=A0AAX3M354_9BACL|nr:MULTISPECIES: transcription elongation factor GreA [Paenibacillus]MDN4618610.1 transcription elongation factor GreA [Paenibacillus sp. PsM32]MDQ1236371.1 transcription elongation factor GreA [Paenibacillus sp. SORGH_AS_0306]MDR6108724.1 transcription elongation factor GreA [Paenibacillus sp. SORGH_AS_0338]WCT55798.1 transcription elongation factor GreA [Paenibacillus kyungheensis]WDF51036.1 transcription elongation factor GreA [Paenibacillus sp. KACC 21273]